MQKGKIFFAPDNWSVCALFCKTTCYNNTCFWKIEHSSSEATEHIYKVDVGGFDLVTKIAANWQLWLKMNKDFLKGKQIVGSWQEQIKLLYCTASFIFAKVMLTQNITQIQIISNISPNINLPTRRSWESPPCQTFSLKNHVL